MSQEAHEPLSAVAVASFLIRNSQQHAARWDAYYYLEDEAVLKRLAALTEEVGELAQSLAGEHSHSPALELIQIGGIVVNWLRHFDRAAVEEAFWRTTTEEHDGRHK